VITENDAPANKHELAYRLIRERIEGAVYQPGQRLVIDALARDLSMSQVPIREAIRRLQAEGWITYRHNSGPEVAHIGFERWQAAMEVLAVLDGYATALAAPALSADNLETMRECVRSMERAVQDFDLLAFAAGNRDFHRVIYARCPNQLLVERISETQAQLEAMRGMLFPNVPLRGNEAIAEHRGLLELFESGGSFDKIEAAAREHKLSALRAAVKRQDEWVRARQSARQVAE
jgi:DNA-binding GntR family transcriptional regulator